MSEHSDYTDSSSSTLTDVTSELRRTITVDEYEILNSALNRLLSEIKTEKMASRDREREINRRFASLRHDMHSMWSEINRRFASLRDGMHVMRSEINRMFAAIRDDMHTKRSEINRKLATIRDDMLALRSEADRLFAAIRDDMLATRSWNNKMFAKILEIKGELEMIASRSERDIDAPPPREKCRGRNVPQHK